MSEIILTHPDKIFWPNLGLTKQDLWDYYNQIMPYILPYLKNRLQVLHRYPDGITGEGFYHKDLGDELPSGIKTVKIMAESTGKKIHYLLCEKEADILYMVNLGCIEMNPWHSRINLLHNPDYLILDLDPYQTNFENIITVAKEIKKLADELKIKCFCKTSGKAGLHIFIPLNAKYNFDQVKESAKQLALIIVERLPEVASIEHEPQKRRGKVYIDYLRNTFSQTIVSAYSLRPTINATVSTPLYWEEINEKLNPKGYTIKTISKRIKNREDIWKEILTVKSEIPQINVLINN